MQIVPFDIDFSSTELGLDFTDTRTALSKLVSSGSIFTWSTENALWKLARAPPKVYHTLHNSKKDLERELKHSCEVCISCQVFFHVTWSTEFALLSLHTVFHTVLIQMTDVGNGDLGMSYLSFAALHAVAGCFSLWKCLACGGESEYSIVHT